MQRLSQKEIGLAFRNGDEAQLNKWLAERQAERNRLEREICQLRELSERLEQARLFSERQVTPIKKVGQAKKSKAAKVADLTAWLKSLGLSPEQALLALKQQNLA